MRRTQRVMRSWWRLLSPLNLTNDAIMNIALESHDFRSDSRPNIFKQELHYGATHVFFYKRRFYSNIFMSSADRKPAEDLELSDRLWSLTASGNTPPGVCKHSRQNHCPEQRAETLCELECFGSWSKRSVYEQYSSVKTAMTSLNDSLTSNFGT